MGKILIVDEHKNTVEIDVTVNTLKLLGVRSEDVKKHTSRRQLLLEITKFIEK